MTGKVREESAHAGSCQLNILMKQRMHSAKRDQMHCEIMQLRSILRPGPLHPAQFTVDTVRIRISLLAVEHLIPRADHRRTLGKHHHRKRIFHLSHTQTADLPLSGGTLRAAVPGVFIQRAVPVILAVFLIVLVIVRDQVTQRESVMAGDRVDHSRILRIVAAP